MKKTKRIALITGGAKRIGAAIARHLHHCGVNVMIHHNQSSIDAKNLVAELNNLRADSAATIQADLLDQESFSYLIKEVINICLLYTSPSPRDVEESRMPSSA